MSVVLSAVSPERFADMYEEVSRKVMPGDELPADASSTSPGRSRTDGA